MLSPRSLGVVASLLVATGCRQTPASEVHPQVIALASSSASSARSAEPAPSAAPARDASAPTNARRIEIAGFLLGDPVAGREPTAAHPKGTVIALAQPPRRGSATGVVEIDVATGTEVTRSKVTVDGAARLVREGDAIHVGAASTASFVWSTMDLALQETRRITPKTRPLVDEHSFEGFAVVGDDAVVVSSARGIVAEILDGNGKTLARHDCKANMATHGLVTVHGAGGLTIVGGLVTDSSALVCGFRSDGSGAPIRSKLALDGHVFTHDGVAYAREAEIHRLDGSLARTGPAIADPRPCSDPRSSCGTMCTRGVTGDAALRAFVVSDVQVLQTVGCCGGPGGGLFFCDPSALASAEH